MPHRIDDARQWRNQAEEARTIADQMTNPECRRIMQGIAHGYMQLAQAADAREAARRRRQAVTGYGDWPKA